jgi:hypothetical protein
LDDDGLLEIIEKVIGIEYYREQIDKFEDEIENKSIELYNKERNKKNIENQIELIT